MSVRMRHTRAHTKNRRSHHALAEPRLSVCPDCKEKHLRHRVCANCGKYRGREVIDVAAIEAKKAKKLDMRKKELREQGAGAPKKDDSQDSQQREEGRGEEKSKPLDAAALSK